ncbi:MAG: lytic murein transglycosylase [Nitrospirota bacterium]
MAKNRFLTHQLIIITTVLLLALPRVCPAADAFSVWLEQLRTEALAKGISEATLDTAIEGLEPIQRVIELDRNQPEFKYDIWGYLDLVITESRIKKGKEMLYIHRKLLNRIKAHYRVQPRFLVAIWALETNFGANIGKFPVIGAVATLAHDTRRPEFFRNELLNALKILDEGHVDIADMRGSWAGAMGQLQFMPSTFVKFAVDEDNDGRKDIWHSLPDVFGSAANFFAGNGWDSDYTWGRQVKLSESFNEMLFGVDTEKTLSEWSKLGVRRVDGKVLKGVNITASLIQPSGSAGPSFLVYNNFRAVMQWNRSYLYALAVCHLADRLQGSGPLQKGN